MWTGGNVEDWDVSCIITNLRVLDPFNVMFAPRIRILFMSSCDVLLNCIVFNALVKYDTVQ